MTGKELNVALNSLLNDTNDEIAILANASSLLYDFLDDVNWVGFYLLKNNKLVLGPFQGKPACVYIELGRGACGRCAESKETVILEDVKKEKNYISCHDETNSEIVIPLLIDNKIYGVLDIDSTSVNRFKESDKITLEESAKIIANKIANIKKMNRFYL
ncbi:MAG TPA: GAF domain-containing protein [Acholeplasmataceae bacterium]|nr:GAF domain-containing protein [Acholeplasmataceae bacterium]